MLASSRRAVYIETGGTVLAFVSAGAPPGPIHLRRHRAPPRAGSRVRLDGQLPVSARWRPPTLDAALLRRTRTTPGLTETAASGLAGHPAVEVAEWAVGRGDLPAAVGASPGWAQADAVGRRRAGRAARGPCRRRARGTRAAERRRRGTHARHLRAFLTWAAHGQAVEPVHRLLGVEPCGRRCRPAPSGGGPRPRAHLGRRPAARTAPRARCAGQPPGTDQVIAGGSTRAQRGPPSPPVRSTVAARDPVGRGLP